MPCQLADATLPLPRGKSSSELMAWCEGAESRRTWSPPEERSSGFSRDARHMSWTASMPTLPPFRMKLLSLPGSVLECPELQDVLPPGPRAFLEGYQQRMLRGGLKPSYITPAVPH